MPIVLRRISILLVGLVLAVACSPAARPQDAKDDVSIARMKKDIFFLASPDCEGRGVGTLGLDLAAQYIAVQFSRAGLKPGGVNGTYFQPFPFSTGAQLDGESTLVIEGPGNKKFTLKQGADFQVIGSSGPGKRTAPLVFAGYGLSANNLAYDDYAGIDVKDKVVVALRRLPRWNDKENPLATTMSKDALAALDAKQNRAEGRKAAAIIMVNDASELPKDALMPFQAAFRISTVTTPYVQIKRAVLDEIMQASTGKNLADTEKAIDGDLKPRSTDLKGWTVTLDVKLKRKEVMVKNVIGVVDGKGPLANETVVVGAHYDHLGYGAAGKDQKRPTFFGADDNGSGTTGMMELARRFAAQKDREGRRMVFMAFTAEESGLIGSRHYTQVAPLFPLKDTTAMFNLDMVGRYEPRITRINKELVTVANGDSTETTYDLTPTCKVYRLVKGGREEVKEGLQADVFKKLPKQGLSAAVTTDSKNKVASITLIPEPRLLVEGFNTAKEFDDLVTKLNPGFNIVKENSRGFFSSDQYNFYLQGIPVVFFWTGEHPDYHRPSDVPERINVAGMKRIADYAELVINDLRTNPKRPEYTPVKLKIGGGGPPSSGPSLRFQPDPFFGGKGVLVDKLVEGGPADKAGIKEGDIIFEMAGKAVTNVATYNAVRATLKAGVEIEVKILRNKKELTLKVTPVSLMK